MMGARRGRDARALSGFSPSLFVVVPFFVVLSFEADAGVVVLLFFLAATFIAAPFVVVPFFVVLSFEADTVVVVLLFFLAATFIAAPFFVVVVFVVLSFEADAGVVVLLFFFAATFISAPFFSFAFFFFLSFEEEKAFRTASPFFLKTSALSVIIPRTFCSRRGLRRHSALFSSTCIRGKSNVATGQWRQSPRAAPGSE